MNTVQPLDGGILEVRIDDTMSSEDYRIFTRHAEEIIDTLGSLRILIEVLEFHGWSAGALWQDLKFDVKHYADVCRLALVGDVKWGRGAAALSRPFTAAEVRYFSSSEKRDALAWLREPA